MLFGMVLFWKRRPHHGPIHRPIAVGIEDFIQANGLAGRIWAIAGRTKGRAKIPITLGRCRHDADGIADESALAELLEAKEEEGSVVTVIELRDGDWPAECEAIIVLADRVANVLPGLGGILSTRVGEGRAGVQGFVYEIVEAAAVDLIPTRLHGVVEVTATRLAIFGGEVAGLDGHLLDGFHAGLVHLVLLFKESVGSVLAFDVDGLRIGRHTIHAQHRVG